MSMAEITDINQPGGWMVRASMLGGLVRTFYVYELDDNKAAEFGENGNRGNNRRDG